MERGLFLQRSICTELKINGNVHTLAIEKKVETMEKAQEHAKLCRRCGRKLISEESKSRGMGETCYRKWITENQHKKLFNVSSLQMNKNSI